MGLCLEFLIGLLRSATSVNGNKFYLGFVLYLKSLKYGNHGMYNNSKLLNYYTKTKAKFVFIKNKEKSFGDS
jgi:hypothetical protein